MIIYGYNEVKRLKITTKTVNAFNNCDISDLSVTCEQWNIDNGLPTNEQYSFMSKVHWHKYGMLPNKITLKDCKDYIKA